MGPGATIRSKALERRAAAMAEVGTDDPRDLVHAEARLAGLTVEVVPVGPGGLSEGEKAWLQPVNRRILLSAACEDGESVEAIAHELAHHHLHDDRALEDGHEPFGSSRPAGASGTSTVPGYSPSQVKETQASLFADEFLCPADRLMDLMQRGVTPVGVADAEGLPRALVRRQAVVGLLRPRRERSEPLPRRRERDRSQARCVAWRDGPVLVTGGPGTGKTTTLVDRAARLLSRRDTHPSSVLVLAGSPMAAETIARRLAAKRPRSVGKAWVGTFEDLAFEVLARWPDAVRSEGIRVLDRVAVLRLLAEVMGQEGEAPRRRRGGLLAALRHIDDAACDPGSLEDAPDVAGLAEAFDARLDGENAIGAGGLVPLAVQALRASPFVRENLRRTFAHVLVDDLQDAPASAVELLGLIHPVSVDVYATGDAGQAMDGFRGRRACAVEAFREAFSPEVLGLDTNHRSTDAVAAVVDALADRGGRRSSVPLRTLPTVSFSNHEDPTAEAAAVAAKVVALRQAGVPLRRQAILAWSHGALRDMADALLAADVPFAHLGDLKKRREVEDVTSFLEFAIDGSDAAFEVAAGLAPYAVPREAAMAVLRRARNRRTSVRSVLERGRLPVRADVAARLRRLRDDAAALQAAPLTAGLTDWLLETDGYASGLLRDGGTVAGRMGLVALHHLLGTCAEHERLGGRDAAGLRARIAVAGSLDQRTHHGRVALHDLGLDAVNLLTIRAARGMEFEVVHAAGLWRKPTRDGESSRADEQERVMRVALSRAREGLHMTRARNRANRELADLDCLIPVRCLLGGTMA